MLDMMPDYSTETDFGDITLVMTWDLEWQYEAGDTGRAGWAVHADLSGGYFYRDLSDLRGNPNKTVGMTPHQIRALLGNRFDACRLDAEERAWEDAQ